MKTFKILQEELKSGLSTKTLDSYLQKSAEKRKKESNIDTLRKSLDKSSKVLDILGNRIPTNEEIDDLSEDQLDEISLDLLKQAKTKAWSDLEKKRSEVTKGEHPNSVDYQNKLNAAKPEIDKAVARTTKLANAIDKKMRTGNKPLAINNPGE